MQRYTTGATPLAVRSSLFFVLRPAEQFTREFLRESLYVCHRCLRRYQTDARVRRITRVLSESEVAT